MNKEIISYMVAPITNKTPRHHISLNDVYTAITREDIYKNRTEKYRGYLEEGDEEKAAESKQSDFDYVTFSGKFQYVSNNGLLEHSNLICIDIDKLGDLHEVEDVKQKLLEDEVIDTKLLFISPSGNGIKWVIGIDVDEEDAYNSHLSYFRAISAYMEQEYSITIDQACKDVARACYLPHDPDCYINEGAEHLGQEFLETWEPPEKKKPEMFSNPMDKNANGEVTPWDDYNKNGDLGRLLKEHGWSYVGTTDKGDEYLRPGNSTNRYSAIHFRDTNILYVHSDSTQLDLGDNTPAKVFCQLEAGGDWKKAAKMLREMGFGKKPTLNIKEPEEVPEAEIFVFWDVDKNGKVSISRRSYIEFLEEELNYAQVRTFGNPELVQIEGKIMHKKDVNHIIQDTRRYIDKLDAPLSHKVADAFITLLGTINRNILTSFLTEIKYQPMEETPDVAYFFYQNKYIAVTDDEVDVKSYDELNGYIWKDQILEREWKEEVEIEDFNFFKFMQNITDNSEERLTSLMTSMGYLLHSYKKHSESKAVLFIDEFEEDSNINASNGGTGKSIIGQSLGYMRKQCFIDGKQFKPSKSKFALSKVSASDKIIFIDDITKGFNFEPIYVQITADMEIERKYENKITIPFEKSPKIVIASNKALSGDDGSSDRRRQHIVEFAPYYDDKFSPRDEFNEEFFADYHWDYEDWQKFDTVMIRCVQRYFKHGLVSSDDTYMYRKTLETIGPEVMEFCDENIKLSTYYTTNVLYQGDVSNSFGIQQGFLSLYDYEISKREFGRRLRIWAEFRGYECIRKRGTKEHRGKRGWIFK